MRAKGELFPEKPVKWGEMAGLAREAQPTFPQVHVKKLRKFSKRGCNFQRVVP